MGRQGRTDNQMDCSRHERTVYCQLKQIQNHFLAMVRLQMSYWTHHSKPARLDWKLTCCWGSLYLRASENAKYAASLVECASQARWLEFRRVKNQFLIVCYWAASPPTNVHRIYPADVYTRAATPINRIQITTERKRQLVNQSWKVYRPCPKLN